jgi:hypothetical protein
MHDLVRRRTGTLEFFANVMEMAQVHTGREFMIVNKFPLVLAD